MPFKVFKTFFVVLAIVSTTTLAFAQEPKNPISEEEKFNSKNLLDETAMQAEMDFYAGNDHQAELIFKGLKEKKNHDVALWGNQLGSLYLAQGRKKEALEAFMDAYLVMNNLTAFKDLELKSVGLTSSEATKAYKGDPYEKVFNSFYVGMLLYADKDFENALASFKNGILCDSDVGSDLYKSDVTILYLMASRLESLQKNQSMADDYFKQAMEAFILSCPNNRALVSQEQSLLDDLAKKQKILLKKEAPYKNENSAESAKAKAKTKTAKLEKEIADLGTEISKLETEIKVLTDKIQENGRKLVTSSLRDIVNLNNNTLLCIETGKGPLKYQSGNFGEKAIFTIKPYQATGFSVTVDNFTRIDVGSFLKNNDIYYQASTRGGRVMDSILKGKAEFKQTTADVSEVISVASQVYDPYGVMSLFSLATKAVSNATNPYADARHWSLIPAEIQMIPLHLNAGTHKFQIDSYDSKGKLIESVKFDLEIKDEVSNVIFKRFRGKIS
ncbi:MAG: hypothetical protein WCY09_01225 [Candidatus Omnitrophota bacterium]